MFESQVYSCFYCGELVEVLFDLSVGDQQYYEDCLVCCWLILFDLCIDGQDWLLNVCWEDD